MKLFRTVLALLVVVGFALCALQGEVNAQQKKKFTAGKVTKVSKDSITVETGKKDAKEMKTFKVNAETKYRKATGEKGKFADATAADVKEGTNVVIIASEDGGTALTITIGGGKKKKDA